MLRRSLVFVTVFAAWTATAVANDWPCWRGPEQTGMSREKAVVTSWSQGGDNLLWKVPVGGRTTPVLLNGRLYAITPAGSGKCLGERVICLDADTGRIIWQHRFNVFHTDIVQARLGWTSVVADPETGNIYAHGTGGEFFCFDRDGKILWKHSLGETFGRSSGYGGRLHTPIIDEDRVVISIVYILSRWGTGPKKAGHRYYAFDKRTGEVLWASQPGGKPLDTTYAVPVVGVIGGKRMLIAANADGNVYGMLARTGVKQWTFRLSKRGLNSSPVIDGNYVYVAHSEENLTGTKMGSVVCIDASKKGDITETGVVWRHDGLTVGYASPAIANGRLYVVTNAAKLICLDAKTGKKYWDYSLGRVMKGSPTVTADGVIYAGTVNGRFLILRDRGDRCVPLDVKTFTRLDDAVVETNGAPIVSNGRVYFMTSFDTYCLGVAGREAESVPLPPGPKEEPRPQLADGSAGTMKPTRGFKTHLQIVPAETTLAPGEKIRYKVWSFDPNGGPGTPIASDSVSTSGGWGLSGVNGVIHPDGTLQADTSNTFSAGKVTLNMAGTKATALVRVSPKLPINETFDQMKVGSRPPGWVGLDVKTKLVEKDGTIVLEKLAKSPSAKYCRMRSFSNSPIRAGYTVEADLLASPKKGRHPVLSDMGLINSRYKLILLGYEKRLRIVSYSPIPRLQEEVPFAWKPDVWYRAKMRVEIRGAQGVIRGKVWPRDQKEPSDWMIEVVDPCPNFEGSPGLYAYSKGTTVSKHGSPVFFDNYQVYRNE